MGPRCTDGALVVLTRQSDQHVRPLDRLKPSGAGPRQRLRRAFWCRHLGPPLAATLALLGLPVLLSPMAAEAISGRSARESSHPSRPRSTRRARRHADTHRPRRDTSWGLSSVARGKRNGVARGAGHLRNVRLCTYARPRFALDAEGVHVAPRPTGRHFGRDPFRRPASALERRTVSHRHRAARSGRHGAIGTVSRPPDRRRDPQSWSPWPIGATSRNDRGTASLRG